MKKANILRRAAALLLASLMLLGAAALSAGAAQTADPVSAWQMQKGTLGGVLAGDPSTQAIPSPGALFLSVKTPPANNEYLLGFEQPNLSGLVVAVNQGGRTFDAAWNDRYGDFHDGNIRIYWNLFTDPSEFPTAPGAVKVKVHYYGESYDYSTWDYRSYSGTLEVDFTALSLLGKMTSSTALTLNVPLATALVGADAEFSPNFYSFTPAASGFYALTASDFAPNTMPFGALLESGGALLGSISYDLGGQPLLFYLEAGKTYYYAVDYMYDKAPVSPYNLKLTVAPYTPSALALNQFKDLDINTQDNFYAILTFTPTKTGDYCFRSTSDGIDLIGELMDSSMRRLKYNDDGYTYFYTPYNDFWQTYGLDFKITYRLTAGETYFLAVTNYEGYFYNYGDTAGAVIVEEAYLRAAPGTVTMNYHSYPPFYLMFQSNYDEILVTASSEYFGWYDYNVLIFSGRGYGAIKTGTTAVRAAALDADGEPTSVTAEAAVRISYTLRQLFLMIFAFGWLWL